MCGPVMRGADALPWSKTTSRTKGSRRNLGDLVWPAVAAAIPGRGRKARSRSCRGTGEESDEPRSTGEAPEQGRDERRRRVWREGGSVGGMADDEGCAGHRTGPSIHITAASLRIGAADQRPRSPDHARPPAGARCGKAARRDLCGGQGAIPVPTATVRFWAFQRVTGNPRRKNFDPRAAPPHHAALGVSRRLRGRFNANPSMPTSLSRHHGDLSKQKLPWISKNVKNKTRIFAAALAPACSPSPRSGE